MSPSDTQEEIRDAVVRSTFSMLAKLAVADGSVRKVEADAVDRFMKNVLRLSEEKREFAVGIFNEARNSPKSFRDFANEYKSQIGDRPEVYQWMLDILIRISLVDRQLSENEKKLLVTACEIFSISQEKLEEKINGYSKTLRPNAPDLHILGCEVDMEPSEIEARYKRLCTEYDPQRIIELGLPEAFVALAKEKMREIEQAYANIKSKGAKG